jgi:hypothetical protein
LREIAIAGYVGAGHAELSLKGEGEQSLGSRGHGPGEVVGGKKPEGIERDASKLKRPENLHGSLTRGGREDGLLQQAGERIENFGERGFRRQGVKGGELVQRAVPTAEDLEGERAGRGWLAQAGGMEQRTKALSPGAIAAARNRLCRRRQAQVSRDMQRCLEPEGQAGMALVSSMCGDLREREFRLQTCEPREVDGVETGGVQRLWRRRAAGRAKERGKKKGADGSEWKRSGNPAQQGKRGLGKGGFCERMSKRELEREAGRAGGNMGQAGRELGGEDAVDFGATVRQVGDNNGYAGSRQPREQCLRPPGRAV